jgi:quinol monooxygenase YgiN
MAIVLTAKYTVKPGHIDEVLGLLRDMTAQVKTAEPCCTLYRVNRSRENPDVLLLFEEYADEAALNAHRETPHFKSIIEAQVVPLLDGRERSIYDAVIS